MFFTGYGKSQGTPNEYSCYSDIEAAYHYLLHTRKLLPEQIVLYGRSLGSGPSCYLAAKTAREGRSVLMFHLLFSTPEGLGSHRSHASFVHHLY